MKSPTCASYFVTISKLHLVLHCNVFVRKCEWFYMKNEKYELPSLYNANTVYITTRWMKWNDKLEVGAAKRKKWLFLVFTFNLFTSSLQISSIECVYVFEFVNEPLPFAIPFVSQDEFVWSKESITPFFNCYRFIHFFPFFLHLRLILLLILFGLFAFLLSFYFIQFSYAVTSVQHALLNIYLVLRFVTQPIFRWHLVQSNDFFFVICNTVCVWVCECVIREYRITSYM